MKLNVRNMTTRVVSISTKEERWLRELLSIAVPSAEYSKAYQKGHWDGKKHFFNKKRRTFPTGLLPAILEENGERTRPFNIKVNDKRRNPFKRRLKTTTEIWERYLRKAGFDPDPEKCEYQARGIRKIVRNTFNGMPWMRGIVSLPTGSGKTIMVAGVIRALRTPRTLIVCDRLSLLMQTWGVLSKVLQRDVGIVGGGTQDLARVTVGMVQTLRTRANEEEVSDWLSGVRLLIIDECHKVGDNSYARVIERVPAFARLGLSATALHRGDPGDVLLVGATGEVLYRLAARDLAARGLLATPVIELIPVREPRIKKKWDEDDLTAAHFYKHIYEEGIVDNEDRNRIIADEVYRAVSNGRPTLVLVKMLRHGRLLLEALREQGIKAEYLRGDDKVEHRQRIASRFKKGKLPCIIASTIFDEAIDIPNIEQLVLAGGGNSPIKAVQRVGRGMRVKPGDNRLYVTDFLDLTHKLLRRNSMQRVQIYREHGYVVQRQEGTWV